MTIKLILSNSYNILADKLSEDLDRNNSNPFQKQSIIVQTDGMQKWLSLKISEKNSVFGNFDFIGVNDFFRRLYYIISDLTNVDDENSSSVSLFSTKVSGLYQKDSLKWIIYDILKKKIFSEVSLIDIRKYLVDKKSDKIDFQKLFQLSSRLADLYDQYLIFRWKIIESWSADKIYYSTLDSSENLVKLEKWQKKIWFYIKNILGELEPDKIEIRKFILDKLNSNLKNPILKDKIQNFIGDKIPLFGFSIIPEYYLEIFNLLSDIIDIPFYLMNPSKEFWYDIEKQGKIDKKELESLIKQKIDPDLLHFDIGNPLLAEMGRTGKDFFNLLLNNDTLNIEILEEYSNFENRDDLTILQTIKQDILKLIDPTKDEVKRVFKPEMDNSVKIVSASSKQREIEILKDYILDVFSANKRSDNNKITATDILVLAPDIEEYSSFIDLLFSYTKTKDDNGYNIPYSISSKSFSSSNIASTVLIDILKISSGKVLSSEIFSIIDSIPVRNKFSLNDENITIIKRWIEQVGIRWGVDGLHRKKIDDVSYDDNSWKKGLNKLLAGLTMFEEKGKSFSGIIPYSPLSSGDGELLGKFIEITNIIFDFADKYSNNSKKSISEWGGYFSRFCDNLFSDGFDDESYSGVDDLKQILNNFNRLFELPSTINVNNSAKEKIDKIKSRNIEFSIISKEMMNLLSINQNKDERFMHKGITFSNLVPMRSIPFKVVCIIGMNQNSFPRTNKNSDIDLIALDPKIGDRAVRDNDLYLFLDTILSAQDNLYISYVGKSIIDNSEQLPSGPVSSLMDYIDKSFIVAGSEKSVIDEILVEHPLQPFSIRYQMKNESKLWTYNNIYSLGQEEIKSKNLQKINFLPKLELNNNENLNNISSQNLIKFFKNPSEFYYTNSSLLSSRFSQVEETLNDRENFESNGLVEYHIAKSLIEGELRGDDTNWLKEKIKSEGNLPYGNNSVIYLDSIENKCKKLVKKLKKEGFKYSNIKTEFDICLINKENEYNISVKVDNFFEDLNKLIYWHTGKLRAKQKIEALITHLLINIRYNNIKTIYISETADSKDNYFSLKEISRQEAEVYLSKLLSLYKKGLSSPLVFFPNSSLEYVEVNKKKRNSDIAFYSNAMKSLYYNEFHYPEINSSEYFNHFFHDSEGFKLNHKDEFIYNSSIVFDIFIELSE